jgi:hypothetical protein
MNSCQKILPGEAYHFFMLLIISKVIFWHELGFYEEKLIYDTYS